jgi:tetratricopeptide (TPR) repeat protein
VEATFMEFCIDNRELRRKKDPSVPTQSRRKFIQQSVFAAGALAFGAPLFGSCTKSCPVPKRPYRTEHNTIAHKMLDIELVHVQSKTSYQVLDQILDVAAHLLAEESDTRKDQYETALYHLKTIDNILKFFEFYYQKNSLLATALETRKIDCDGYSAIYLAIGELLNLPIKMVRAPAHTFVRWHIEEHVYINWETTIGAPKSDNYYILKHKIAKRARGRSALKSLDVDENREQILANSFVNCGVEWLKKLNYEKALAYFDKAIKGDPLYEAPYYNKGLVYFHMGDMNQAVTWCEKAVLLNPNHMKSHAVLGTAYKELNKNQKAQLHFRRVRELDPEYYAVKIMEMQLSEAVPASKIQTI